MTHRTERYSVFCPVFCLAFFSAMIFFGSVRGEDAPVFVSASPPVVTPPFVTASDEAWQRLKTYQPGEDRTPLLVIEQEVAASCATDEAKRSMAARLAGYLSPESSLACRQFVCMQLRLVGGDAQVPILAKLLDSPDDSENGRGALEALDGEASSAALRAGLSTAQGRALIGLIGSLAKRRDSAALPDILTLTKSADRGVKSAATQALGAFGRAGWEGICEADFPVTDATSANAAIRIAGELAESGDAATAREIYSRYMVEEAPRGVRQAALTGSLRLTGGERAALILDWFASDSPTKIRASAAHLEELSDEEFSLLAAKEENLSEFARLIFLQIAAKKEGPKAFDRLRARLDDSDPVLRAAAAQLLGKTGDAIHLPTLLERLADSDKRVIDALDEAILSFPKETAGPLLLDVMNAQDGRRKNAIDLLATMKYYDAIDSMIAQAESLDPKIHEAALAGLARLADPDETDLSRLMKLYFFAAKNGYRDKVERTIVFVGEKNSDTAEIVARVVERQTGITANDRNLLLLPLLGKLGGAFAHEQIRAGLAAPNPQIKGAAMRGFCNWPDATYADELWTFATESSDAAVRQMALRAFVRVITLRSSRDPNETLRMLKNAMNAASQPDDRRLILVRASEIRTMETVRWLAEYLADAPLQTPAATSIVRLAHYRELRSPNAKEFIPILEEIEALSPDAAVVEAAKKARMGM